MTAKHKCSRCGSEISGFLATCQRCGFPERNATSQKWEKENPQNQTEETEFPTRHTTDPTDFIKPGLTLALLLIFIIVSGIKELPYLRDGKVTTARIENVERKTASRGRRIYIVEYSFQDDLMNKKRVEKDRLAESAFLGHTSRIGIEYIPGKSGHSRVGKDQSLGFWLIAGCAASFFLIFRLAILWKNL